MAMRCDAMRCSVGEVGGEREAGAKSEARDVERKNAESHDLSGTEHAPYPWSSPTTATLAV